MKSIYRLRRYKCDKMRKISILLLVAFSMGLSGCDLIKRTRTKFKAGVAVENYYVDSAALLKVSRVLVLPFVNDTGYAGISRSVTDTFALELNKTGRFDVLSLSKVSSHFISDKLVKGSPIDENDIKSLCTTYKTDAVILGEIRSYGAYKPFVLGLKISMFSPKGGGLLWVVDETFDGCMRRVANSARAYYYGLMESDMHIHKVELMENSIKYYTRFVCATLVSTLGPHKMAKK